MPRKKTPTDVAAGRLVLAIQKVWGYRLGTNQAAAAEAAMNRAHDLQQAARSGTLEQLLGTRNTADYVGRDWVECHPGVKQAAANLEASRTLMRQE
jgi:hypothetical protein